MSPLSLLPQTVLPRCQNEAPDQRKLTDAIPGGTCGYLHGAVPYSYAGEPASISLANADAANVNPDPHSDWRGFRNEGDYNRSN